MSAALQAMAHAHLKYFNLQKFEHLMASLQSLTCKREANRKFLLIRS